MGPTWACFNIYIYIYILVNSKNGYIGLIYKGKILTKHYYTI
jgi:hypothetical protein